MAASRSHVARLIWNARGDCLGEPDPGQADPQFVEQLAPRRPA
jgi:hypothetical protein